ncbi:MAG: excinuclease ABC subunit UvrC [Erysipelotrichaceae bacterium]|nr:excinuclease ABC subunit UvrC [Erysipelotrichaceae bacterium]
MSLSEKLSTLPKKPGVYLHKDKDGNVIYVGKAINLFNRVNSYFRGAHDYKTTKLVSNIRDFDYIVTKSEKEALILEYNLIKQYDPKFNIVFKDDKSYPYILIHESDEPYVSVVRKNKKSKFKGKLFGPFPDVGAARNMVELINKIYPTRKCKNLQKELCLYFHLKQCPGYCVYPSDSEENKRIKENIFDFLNGECKEVIKDLRTKMNECVESLNYEKAAEYRDLINDIETSTLKQDVQKNSGETFDVFNYYVEDGYISITGLFVKKGILLSSDKYTDYLVGDAENFVSSYIYQFYEINEKPKTLYLPDELLPYFGDALNCTCVTRGYKYQLLKQAQNNSIESLKQNKKIITRKNTYYEDLDEEFMRLFNKHINRIELFDNSHTGGTNTVGGMVVYKDFKPSKKDYRMYKLEEGADDLSSMREMLYRRYFRVLKDNLERPDLLIVDGGKLQIDIAKEILESLAMDITIVGLGKDDHHNTSYIMNTDYEIIDIRKDSNLFFFLANMQDEVHRFAITYHKKLRSKSVYKSVLDDVEGLGPKSRNKLLKEYKSISRIKQCSLEELEKVLNKNTALKLYNKLQEEKDA